MNSRNRMWRMVVVLGLACFLLLIGAVGHSEGTGTSSPQSVPHSMWTREESLLSDSYVSWSPEDVGKRTSTLIFDSLCCILIFVSLILGLNLLHSVKQIVPLSKICSPKKVEVKNSLIFR